MSTNVHFMSGYIIYTGVNHYVLLQEADLPQRKRSSLSYHVQSLQCFTYVSLTTY